MKSTIENKETKEKSKYPYLGIMPDGCGCSGLVVLFTSGNTGICVRTGQNGYNKIGEYSDNWAEWSFVPFDGRVFLEND